MRCSSSCGWRASQGATSATACGSGRSSRATWTALACKITCGSRSGCRSRTTGSSRRSARSDRSSAVVSPASNNGVERPRFANVERKTAETHVRVELNLDGTGQAQVSTRSEEHTSELQSLMRISYAVFCLKKQKHKDQTNTCEY